MAPSWHPVNEEELFGVPIRYRISSKLTGAFLFVENFAGIEIGNI